jgi:peptidylprolyl isomerase domain and WD repeat-containing protein 1
MSLDGHLKFWSKVFFLIEFAKHYRAHKGPITGYSLSHDHCKFMTVSTSDNSVKIFDVQNFDLIHMIRFDFTPGACEFIDQGET